MKKNELDGSCSKCEREERCIQGFGRKHEVKRPLGRTRCRWEGSIKMDLQEVGWGPWN
jgi:hypothetical protein